MPEKFTTEIQAQKLKVGDYLGETRGYVTKVEVKQKFTYVTDGNDSKPERIENTNMVRVVRERPTAAEKYDAVKRQILRSIDRTELSAEADLTHAREKIKELMDGDMVVSHWEVRRLTWAQAQAGIWRNITRTNAAVAYRLATEGKQVIDRPFGRPEVVVDTWTRIDELRRQVAEAERRLLDVGMMSLESRSTSQMSNACEDIEREVKLRWIREWRNDFEELDRTAADAQASE